MSNTLRTYNSIMGNGGSGMQVTAFSGGRYGMAIQVSIGSKYCALAQNQVSDLITTLQNRLNSTSGYGATEADLDVVVNPQECAE